MNSEYYSGALTHTHAYIHLHTYIQLHTYFSWRGGHPVRTGVFSCQGTFVLPLAAPPPGEAYKLTLYTALHDFAKHRVRNVSGVCASRRPTTTPPSRPTRVPPSTRSTTSTAPTTTPRTRRTTSSTRRTSWSSSGFRTMACNTDPERGRCAWSSLMGATVQRFTPGLTGGVVLRSVQVRRGSEHD